MARTTAARRPSTARPRRPGTTSRPIWNCGGGAGRSNGPLGKRGLRWCWWCVGKQGAVAQAAAVAHRRLLPRAPPAHPPERLAPRVGLVRYPESTRSTAIEPSGGTNAGNGVAGQRLPWTPPVCRRCAAWPTMPNALSRRNLPWRRPLLAASAVTRLTEALQTIYDPRRSAEERRAAGEVPRPPLRW